MRRGGYLLVEVFVACSVLAALFALVISMVAATARARRATERRAIALEQAANLLERAGSIPFDQLSTATLDEVLLSEQAAGLLPGSEVRWTVSDEESEIPAKRVAVELSWQVAKGRTEAPVRLVAWAFPAPVGAAAGEAADPDDSAAPAPVTGEDPS